MERNINALDDVEVDVQHIINMLWRSRWLFFAVICVASTVGFIYASLAKPVFEAKAIIAPVSQEKQSGMLNKLGGLASLAGISVGSQSDPKNYLAIIKSTRFHKHFIEKEKLLKTLYSDCLSKGGGWINECEKKPPTHLEAAVKLKNILEIKEDQKTGLITVSMQDNDSELVASVVNRFIFTSNLFLRDKARTQTEKNIKFLSEELKKTRELEIKNVLYSMLEKEMQSKKLVGNKDEFAFEVIDPAYIPKERIYPNRRLILVSSVALGVFISCIIVFLLPAFRKKGINPR